MYFLICILNTLHITGTLSIVSLYFQGNGNESSDFEKKINSVHIHSAKTPYIIDEYFFKNCISGIPKLQYITNIKANYKI